MRFFLIAVLVSAGVICSAAEFVKGTLSTEFLLYLNGSLKASDAAALSNGVQVPGTSPQKVVPKNGYIDIAALVKKSSFREQTPALLSMTYTAEEDGRALFGVGAEGWFECYINGKKVHYFRLSFDPDTGLWTLQPDR